MAGTNARMELARASARWLAAPLPAEGEYTRAAVAYAEGMHDDNVGARDFGPIHDKWVSLYRARHSAAASAPAIEESTFDSKAADGERVAVYVRLLEDGDVAGSLYSESETRELALAPGQSWLALDARVVREGGAR